MFVVKNLLDGKRRGCEIPANDIRELIAAYTRGDVPDYQMAAFAMAVCCNGMTADESFALTDSMRLSGVSIDWSDLPLPTADKHSTGGVGDKLSLLIQPLAAACGIAVPSLTGRGLGHTGGTADKLESIPGYRASLSLNEFRTVVSECGVSMTVQTEEIAPADRKLYALRDVTGTVASIPLIVASILSKKLAEGAQTLVFDVKCGRGAFMKTREDAEALAKALVDGSVKAGRKADALVTDMDDPIGYAVGNANEVMEALSVLRGASSPADVRGLSVEFASRMVCLAKGVTRDVARAECEARLADGSALHKFERMVELQGGDLAAFERKFASAPAPVEVRYEGEEDLTITSIDALGIANAALLLGAGRAKADDVIDDLAGVTLNVRRGDVLKKGDIIARLVTATRKDRIEEAAKLVKSAIGR